MARCAIALPPVRRATDGSRVHVLFRDDLGGLPPLRARVGRRHRHQTVRRTVLVEVVAGRNPSATLKASIPKSLAQAFADPQTDDERTIKGYIDEANERQVMDWQQELFAQRARLVKAEQKLAEKYTKGAAEDQRIATEKIERIKGWLENLTRSTAQDDDSRIYPAWYAPVMVMEEGRLVVKPMRYQCRPAGKPAMYDIKFPGTYNALGTLLTVRTVQPLLRQRSRRGRRCHSRASAARGTANHDRRSRYQGQRHQVGRSVVAWRRSYWADIIVVDIRSFRTNRCPVPTIARRSLPPRSVATT
jgi:hypothetical protein